MMFFIGLALLLGGFGWTLLVVLAAANTPTNSGDGFGLAVPGLLAMLTGAGCMVASFVFWVSALFGV